MRATAKTSLSATILAGFALCVPLCALAEPYDTPPIVAAHDLVPDVPLRSENYAVEISVPTDGFMADYRITSPFGTFSASGPGMLPVRLNEIDALAALETMQEDQRFMDAAEDTAKDTAKNLRRIVKNPKETLQGIPQGVGRFFKRTERAITTGAQKLDDAIDGRRPGTGADVVSALPGGGTAPSANDSGSLAANMARAGGDTVVNILGFDKQRRRLAQGLNVDPYTTNRALAKKLDDVTWAAFAGGLSVNVLTSLIPGGMILSTSSRLSDWVWDTSPGDLRVEIEKALLDVGAEQQATDRFLRHAYYTMSMQAVLADALKGLDGTEGLADTVPLILGVGSEGQAQFLVQSVDMLRTYHQEVAPLAAVQVQGTIIGVGQSGRPVVMAPVDYLSWTPTLDTFATNLEADFALPPVLYTTGQLSPRATEALDEKDWDIIKVSAQEVLAYPIR